MEFPANESAEDHQLFEHFRFRKPWTNVVKAKAAAHPRWIPLLPYTVTVPTWLQFREPGNFFLHFCYFSKW